ncbi:MAG: DUF1217 domain-containing protein [Phyllobacterium sp.]
MTSTMTSYRLIAADLPRSLARVAKEPMVQRDSDYYLENIGDVKTIDDFMRDTKLYNYALKAFGLDDMAYAKAFIRKVLTEGIDDKDSFANKLTDTRYKEFAAAFDFVKHGDKTTSQPEVLKPVVDNYVRLTLEAETGKQSDGARLALYFSRKASSITSAYQILGDKRLLAVFQTTFGIPAETSRMDIDRQARMFEEKLDLKDLQDPKKVEALLTRFTAMYDISNPSESTLSPTLALFGGTPAVGISQSILATLQSFKLGGR